MTFAMKRHLKNFIVLCALVHMTQGVLGSENSENLARLFFRSRMASKDPLVTMACFTDYIGKTNDVSEAYSRKYNQCLVDAKNDRENVQNDMAKDRADIAMASVGVCKRLETCNNLNTTLDVFNCHSDIGANNTKTVYSIAGNASELAGVMQEKYRLIDLKHEQCCKTAERKYVEETALAYRALQDCLEGRVIHTTEVPVTTTTARTTTTTIDPATTTTTAPTTTTIIDPTTTSTIAPTTTTSTPIRTTTTSAPTTSVPLPTSSNDNLEATTLPSKFNAKELAAQILDIFK